MAPIVDPEEREVEALRRLTTFSRLDVLDVGCGEGRTTRRIARTAASVLGVDPDVERITKARDAVTETGSCETRFLVDDIVTLDLPAAGFDVVVFARSL